MRSTLTLLIVQLLLVSNVRAATVKLIVTVPDSTPTDASIYLAGSLPSVGEWKVDGVKLDREGDRFVSTIQLEGDQTLEFKITRGSWETVEKNRDGSERANRLLDAKHAEVSVTVEAWSTGIEKPAPSVVGTLEIFTIDSKSLNQQRTIRVWLPPGYADASDRKFPVLYMHDGQNCFDRATSAFGVEWQIDETLTKLISDGTIAPMIVVGMDNGGASRTKNYTFDIDKERGGGGAAHANFLIDEV
ncbi:MAG TPA: alpha/beta hydrolase-fold protein, partial [Tepidisphaeraceae bacterium]|nr:alpha/beta hydrolase-fold protein [Tepidisphaeraceae bacterium]